MITLRHVIFYIMLFNFFPALADEYFVTPSERVVTELNVRDIPSGLKIGFLKPGEHSELIEKVPFWYKVKLGSGIEGYVAKGYSKLIPKSENPELKITYLHTGAGTCSILNCPSANKSILMDCGSWPGSGDTNFHQTEVEIGQKLKEIIGDSELSAVISHGDTDHYNYVPIALAGIQLKEIWLGGFSSFYTQKGFPDWLNNQKIGGAHIHKDLDVNFHSPTNAPTSHLSCGTADIFILSNRTKGNIVANEDHRNRNSLVTLVEYNDFRAIFTGDSEKATEKQIMENYPNLTASVVTASHHGSKSHGSNHLDWVNQIKAKAVIYTSGFKHEHPKCDSVKRYRKYLATSLKHDFTCDAGESKPYISSLKAEYGTEPLGDITITTSGVSSFEVKCSRDKCFSMISI